MKKINFFSKIFKKENQIKNLSIKRDSEEGGFYFVDAITGERSSSFVSKKYLGNGVFLLSKGIFGFRVFFLDTKTMKQSRSFLSAKKIDGEIYLARVREFEQNRYHRLYVFFDITKMTESSDFYFDSLEKLRNGVFLYWHMNVFNTDVPIKRLIIFDAKKNKEFTTYCDDVKEMGNGSLVLYFKKKNFYEKNYVSFFDIEKMEQSELIEAVNVKKIKKDFLLKNH